MGSEELIARLRDLGLHTPTLAADLIEKQAMQIEALLARASTAEHRLASFRQHNAARGEALRQFIKDRAPELWGDYATVSVNGSVYSEDYTLQPVFERELNSLRWRCEDAEERAAKAERALAASPSPTNPLNPEMG